MDYFTFINSNKLVVLYKVNFYKAEKKIEESFGGWISCHYQSPPSIEKSNPLIATNLFSNPLRPRYLTHSQALWNLFSCQTIEMLSEKIKNSPSNTLKDILFWLGHRRQAIMQIIQNGAKGRVYHYGKIRGEQHLHVHENLFENSKHHHQQYLIIKKRLAPLLHNNSYFLKMENIDATRYYTPRPKDTDLTITYTDKQITITYPETTFNKICAIETVNDAFNDLLSHDMDALEEVIPKIGELCYFLFRSLPFCLGSSSIIEWLARGIALSKNIDLKAFNDATDGKQNTLFLDWQAFITFDEKEYGTWFRNAFPDACSLSIDNTASYQQSPVKKK